MLLLLYSIVAVANINTTVLINVNMAVSSSSAILTANIIETCAFLAAFQLNALLLLCARSVTASAPTAAS